MIPIRKGFSINPSDGKRMKLIQNYASKNFITIIEEKYLDCKCGKTNKVPYDNIENYVKCVFCPRKNSITKAKPKIVISSVNFLSIRQHIETILSDSNHSYVYDESRHFWLVDIKGIQVPLLIPEISYSNFIIANASNEVASFITLDKDSNYSLINSMNESQFLEFQTIIDDPTLLAKNLTNVATTFKPNYSLILESKFNKMLDKISFSQFELFCKEFLNELQVKHELLTSFYNYLNQKKDTPINLKVILLGGASNPDFYTLDISDYLQSGLKPSMFGESKQYKKSKFTIADFGTAITHSNLESTLFFVSTNDIQKEVWVKIIGFKRGNTFKFVLLDKDLILILIKCLEMENLIEKYL